MGWDGSKGLGKHSTGIRAPIAVEHKADKLGLGQKQVEEHWTSADNVKRKLLVTEMDESQEELARRVEKAKALEAIKSGEIGRAHV